MVIAPEVKNEYMILMHAIQSLSGARVLPFLQKFCWQYHVGLQVGAWICGEVKNNCFVSSLHINFGESGT